MVLAVALASVAALIGMAPQSALAALGANAVDVAADPSGATLAVTKTPKYTVREITALSGTAAREFVSPTGTVFAVAWTGPTMPDLRQLLGSYFDPYVAAAAQHRGRAPVLIEQPGLVVQSRGHMRAFVGRAYLPQAVPQGVATEEIK